MASLFGCVQYIFMDTWVKELFSFTVVTLWFVIFSMQIRYFSSIFYIGCDVICFGRANSSKTSFPVLTVIMTWLPLEKEPSIYMQWKLFDWETNLSDINGWWKFNIRSHWTTWVFKLAKYDLLRTTTLTSKHVSLRMTTKIATHVGKKYMNWSCTWPIH